MTAVFARFHERTRGSVERPSFYETILTGAFDFRDGADQKLRTAVHLDAAGTPDGYVAYRPDPRKDGHRAIQVSDLVALTPAAYLRLWRFLADVDLSDTVEWDGAPIDDPLSWALVDPFLARVTRRRRRPVGPRPRRAGRARRAAVGPRRRRGPRGRRPARPRGRPVPRGHPSTAWPRSTPTDASPRCGWTPTPSASLYLGGVRVDTLRRAGRIAGTTPGSRPGPRWWTPARRRTASRASRGCLTIAGGCRRRPGARWPGAGAHADWASLQRWRRRQRVIWAASGAAMNRQTRPSCWSASLRAKNDADGPLWLFGRVADLDVEAVRLEDVEDRLLLDPGRRGVHPADELRVAGRVPLVRAAVQRVRRPAVARAPRPRRTTACTAGPSAASAPGRRSASRGRPARRPGEMASRTGTGSDRW